MYSARRFLLLPKRRKCIKLSEVRRSFIQGSLVKRQKKVCFFLFLSLGSDVGGILPPAPDAISSQGTSDAFS